MNALFFLYRTRLKNRLLSLVKSPGQLIVVLLVIALAVLNFFANRLDGEPAAEYRDISEIYAGILVLYAIIFLLNASNGITKGGSLFSMADVNLIFVSGISPVKTMFYGLIQQLGTSILVGLFLIFQYAWLNSVYGVSASFVLIVLLGYAFCLLCGQITSMAIYSVTSGRLKNQRAAKVGIFLLCAISIAYAIIRGLNHPNGILQGAVAAANGPALSLFPVAGWLKTIVVGTQSGESVYMITGSLSVVIYIAAMVALLTKAGDSYYEDVLQTTEQTFKAITASKSGSVGELAPHNVKVGKAGIRNGFGASTFYFKHKLENRRARVFLFDLQTFIFLGISIALGFFMRSQGLPMVFIMSTYMMIFSTALDRWVKELVKPYIYLIPEPPFKKLIHCLRVSLYKLAAEAILLFAIIYFFVDMTIPDLILAVLARISFGLLFTSANLFIERFFSWITVKMLAVMLYFASMIIFAVPGIIVAVIMSALQAFSLPENILILSSLFVCNMIVATITTFLSRNMLEFAELNTTR